MGNPNVLFITVILCIWVDLGRTHNHKPIHYQPEQVHLSFGEAANEVVVTWSTFDSTPESIVKYGTEKPNIIVKGSSRIFVDGGEKKRAQYIHRVRLTELQPNKKYVYRCGSSLGWSEEFWFNASNPSHDWSPRVAIFGDLGNINAKSLPFLQEETQDGLYDAIIHVGDMAYDMRDDDGRVGDAFMNQIEAVAAYVPYMVCPGNHEEAYNFSHYRERFSMPGPYESLFYSFDLGPVHFISINTEAYYFVKYGMKLLVNQYNWLVQDLQEATKPENRLKRPWIVVYGHRPMYCSNIGTSDCNFNTTRTRIGMPVIGFGLEKLFYDHGVDLQFWGHQHSYERMWPLYDYKVANGSLEEPYRNPTAPVHITTGSAGCEEFTTNFTQNVPSWSAARSIDYGYTKLHFANSSHVKIEQVSVDLDGEIIDSLWVIKDSHGPFVKKV